MGEYEIRILRQDGVCSAIIEQVQLNDHAAIRAAQKLAGELNFEVWRGSVCVYGVLARQESLSASEPQAKSA